VNAIMPKNLHHFVIEMIKNMYNDVYFMHTMCIHPLKFEGNLILYVFALCPMYKINMKNLHHLVVYEKINNLWYSHPLVEISQNVTIQFTITCDL